MKKILLFISIFAVNFISQAQNNTFPTDNATWTNRYQDYWYDMNTGTLNITYEQYTKYCIYGTDSTINATTYNEIFTCDLLGSNYFGAFREDSGQVFFVPADSTSEFLLYDFSLNVGESQDVIVQDIWDNSFTIVNVEINSVDTITVNNTQRRQLLTNQGLYWTEGIGSTTGLFKGNGENVSNFFIDLICVSTNDTIVYDFNNFTSGPILAEGIPGNCDLALTIQEPEIEADFSIYPNPSNGLVNIETKNNLQIETITLINTVGREIWTFSNSNSDLSEFEINGPSGIYFVELLTSDGRKTTKKVVKY